MENISGKVKSNWYLGYSLKEPPYYVFFMFFLFFIEPLFQNVNKLGLAMLLCIQ